MLTYFWGMGAYFLLGGWEPRFIGGGGGEMGRNIWGDESPSLLDLHPWFCGL